MIITIIAVSILDIGFILSILYDRTHIVDCLDEGFISAITIVGMFFTVLCLTFIGRVQISYELNYQTYKMQRENLTAELTKASELTISITNTDLGSRIDKYNRFILSERTLSANPWVSWFYNAKVGSLETISASDYYTVVSK